MKNTKKIALGLMSLFVTGSLVACQSSQQSESSNTTEVTSTMHKLEQIKVVATLDFYGEAASKVLGKHGTVDSLISSQAAEPHEFEPTVDDAKKIEQANFVIYNGLGYDAWTEKLLAASHQNQRVAVNVATNIMNKVEGDNEHIWYQPDTMIKVTEDLIKQFSILSPQYADEFRKNGEAYIQELQKVIDKADQVKALAQSAKVDVSEPVYDYALEYVGLTVNNKEFAKAAEEGTDPSPKAIEEVNADLKNKKVKLFVYNPQETNDTIDNLVKVAKDNHIPVIEVSETLPVGKTYAQWMFDQYQSLENALK